MSIDLFLQQWPRPYLTDQDLVVAFAGQDSKRHDAVKYALHKGTLVRLRRGVYWVNRPYLKTGYPVFELAQVMYGPSYISLESALSVAGWIPEAVYNTTCVTTRRKKSFRTPAGVFLYQPTPEEGFYNEVKRIQTNNETYLIAEPWKAVADCIYVYRKSWQSLAELCADLRVEMSSFQQRDRTPLERLSHSYDSPRVRKILSNFLKELT